MNNFFTTIFASEKTPKWFKILIKYGMILLLLRAIIKNKIKKLKYLQIEKM